MSRPSNNVHWINRDQDDLDFPMNDELFEALNHRPKSDQDISKVSFQAYLQQMQKEQPIKAMGLYLKLQNLKVLKKQADLKDQIFKDDRFSQTQKKEMIQLVVDVAQGRLQQVRRSKRRITDLKAQQVRELAETTNNISLVARVYRISRGVVNKICKNRLR